MLRCEERDLRMFTFTDMWHGKSQCGARALAEAERAVAGLPPGALRDALETLGQAVLGRSQR